MAVVINEDRFGALEERVENIHGWVQSIASDVKNLTAAYNQAKGAAGVVAPFKNYIVGGIVGVFSFGLLMVAVKYFPIVAAMAAKGGP